MEGHWKFIGGGEYQKPSFLKENKALNWNFRRGGGFKTKKTFRWGCRDIFWNDIFSCTCIFVSVIKRITFIWEVQK